MRKKLLIIMLLVSVVILSGCGSAVDKLNDTETKVYNALVAYGTENSADPTSIKLFKSSDPFDGKSDYFIGVDSATGDKYYYHYRCVTPDHKYVMIDMSIPTNNGSSKRDTFFIPIDDDDEYYGHIFNYEHFYSEWEGWEDTDSNEAAEQLFRLFAIQAAVEAAQKAGYELAEDGSYPITQGNLIDISKVNVALQEHWKEIGIS